MEVEILNTTEDYSAFLKYYYFKGKITRVKLFVVLWISLLGAAQSAGEPLNLPIRLLRVVVLFAISFSILYLIPYSVAAVKNKKRLLDNSTLLKKKRIVLKEDGFLVESEDGNTFWRYDTIMNFGIRKDFIFLTLLNSGFYVLPKRNFASENEAVNFLGMIKSKISDSRAKPGNDYIKRTRLYYLGLFGLWPGIGAVVCSFLTYLGILKYKDKTLTGIGLSGVLFQVLIFILFFYMQSSYNRESRVPLVQMELTRAAKEIEIYKIQNGVYPDSLQCIKSDKDLIFINDGLSGKGALDGGKNFYYQKIGNKYTLFSVGMDGIPYTKDDIYPDLIIKDSSKYGLIKVNNEK